MTAPEVATAALPDRLLEVATRLFARQGFEGTSVAQIVEAAGVTKGALYHYFDSKDDLLHEIYARVLRMQLQRLEEIDSRTGGPAERLHAAAGDVVLTSIANLDDTTVFQRSMHLLHPDKQREFRAERRRYHERFRAIVRQGQDSGEFRTDVPADLALHFFFGCVHHLDTWYHPDGPLPATEVARHFADLLVTSLRPALT